jgi:hypothetical protein
MATFTQSKKIATQCRMSANDNKTMTHAHAFEWPKQDFWMAA